MSLILDSTKLKKLFDFIGTGSFAIGYSCFAGNAIATEIPQTVPLFQLTQQPNCAAPQTQREINACANLNWQISDIELRRSYENLAPNLSLSRRQELIESQLAWENFRNAECQFYGSLAQGSTSQPALEYGCLAALSQQRTADLNTYLRGEFIGASNNSDFQVENQLNKLYQQLFQSVASVSRQNQLGNAQFAWIEFRDFMCNFERSGGGSLALTNCLIRSTEQRVRQLENHLANLG
ncbi:DUF1311 domain-containing protein [Oscillatoriales cyanobacterium LEGE 11467]|uniref:DUF1311 domain-containing protein n=1 Tax=Zarconia navalis LEGE 11467 TaxID=1828826 RepID=A0A928ZBJ1_9CYAN|nr:LprI family protein [Zarconia navalis]MBE9042731.1 DUF1311 domain-containing protein [Zarconia navalis LEGE 11467]